MRNETKRKTARVGLKFAYVAFLLCCVGTLYGVRRYRAQQLIRSATESLTSADSTEAATVLEKLRPSIWGLSKRQYCEFLVANACCEFISLDSRRAATADLIRAAPPAGILLVREIELLRSRQTLAALGEVVLDEDRSDATRENSLNTIEDLFLRELRFGARSDPFSTRLAPFREWWRQPPDRQVFSDWWEEAPTKTRALRLQ